MDGFDKREDGFERAFAREEELQFRARAQRNRRIAAWAGAKLGLADAALGQHTAALTGLHETDPNDEALVAELTQALAGQDLSEPRIRRRLDEFGQEALAELQAGRASGANHSTT